MRARAAILILTAWPCFIHAQNSHPRKESPNFAQGINENLITFLPCVKNLGLSKCVTAYGVWRAEKSLQADADPATDTRFPWQRYYNTSKEDLYTQLCDDVERLLQRRSLQLNLNKDYSLQLGVTGNGSLNVDVLKSELTTSGRATKKMEKYFYELVPFMVLPGLLMSAVLPFFLPTLKMMTIGAGMLNSMALTGAVFTLLRNNAFDHRYENKVIYLNNGYLNNKLEPLGDGSSDIIVEDDFEKFNGKFPDKFTALESNIKDFHIAGDSFDNDFSSDWEKQLPGKDSLKLFRNNFIENTWKKKYDT